MLGLPAMFKNYPSDRNEDRAICAPSRTEYIERTEYSDDDAELQEQVDQLI